MLKHQVDRELGLSHRQVYSDQGHRTQMLHARSGLETPGPYNYPGLFSRITQVCFPIASMGYLKCSIWGSWFLNGRIHCSPDPYLD